jgi:hypothetical protein
LVKIPWEFSPKCAILPFIENNESISDLTKLKLDSLDAIDEANFSDLINNLKRAKDSIKPESQEHPLIVEFLHLKFLTKKEAIWQCPHFLRHSPSPN